MYSPKVFAEQLDKTIDMVGVWLLYTRTDRRFRCTHCYSPVEGGSRPDCSTCFGTGYQVELERWLCFYTNSIRRTGDVQSPLNPTGFNPNHTDFVFSKRDNIPVAGDIFFLVGWNRERKQVPAGGRPVRVDQALEVSYVEPLIAGETIYYLSHCFSKDYSKRAFEQVIHGVTIVRTRA